MRTLDIGFAAHIASGETTLATCWLLVRRDAVRLGFTDHDQTLAFDGDVYAPTHGLDGSETTVRTGAQVATSEVVGVLSGEAIDADDIRLGRYDGAVVETWRVNWRNVSQRHLLRRDRIGEIVEEDGRFRAELRSGQHALNVPRGRIYQALCDARLGDARCGVDLEDEAFRAAATVVEVRDRYSLEIAGVDGFAAGWFGFGHVLWADGRRVGLRDAVLSHLRTGGEDVFAFDAPVGDWVEAGDALTAYAGCDRRLQTCRSKFGNSINFRGFPHIPGSDYVLRYPKSGAVLDGAPIVK